MPLSRNTPLPPQEVLKRLFNYNTTTGQLTWNARDSSDFVSKTYAAERTAKTWNAKNAGKSAFPQTVRGYRRGGLNGQMFLAHRVVWKMFNGTEPEEIDHVNGVRDDNRIENLRSADKSLNQRNTTIRSDNTSGRTGVYWYPKYECWLAKIGSRRSGSTHIGYFPTFDEAKAAREQAERALGYPENGRRRRTP